MDQIKEAFNKVKQDIDFLKNEINTINSNFLGLKNEIIELNERINNLKIKENIPLQKEENLTNSTHLSTQFSYFKPLKDQNLHISTGNEGVQTDKQTDKQTVKQTPERDDMTNNYGVFLDQENIPITKKNQDDSENSIENVINILDSLDNLKKEIRLKFKRLTTQEFLVFTTLYQTEEEEGSSDYKTLARRLNLTESSIRDYISRLIKKGIPVEKNKINNKNIKLKISSNLKKIANLPTILQLRDL